MAEEKAEKAPVEDKAQKAVVVPEEKGQSRAWTKKLDKKYGKSTQLDLVDRDPLLTVSLEEKFRKSLPYQKVIIPNELARKNGIRVSTIKALLKMMEAEGKVKLFASNDRVKVYTGVDSDKKQPKEAGKEGGKEGKGKKGKDKEVKTAEKEEE